MKKALIVDESAMLRYEVRHAISRTGVVGIFDFDRGADAMSAIRSVRPAVVIIGYQLEDMAGFTLSRQIRALPEFKEMPLILLSPKGHLEDVMEAVDNGVDDYVILPFEDAHLAQKVRVALARVPEQEPTTREIAPEKTRRKGYAHSALLAKKNDESG